MTIEDIKIDEEFKTLCPGLSSDELRQLRDNIIQDGQIREPLIVWDGILIDGHNRLDVWNNLTPAERQKVQKPMMTPKNFGSREEAHNWIITNQLGRRNIDAKQRAYLIGLKYEAKKRNKNENLKTGEEPAESPIRQTGASGTTAEEVAAETGVSPRQVQRSEEFKKAIERIKEILGEDAKKEAMAKGSKISKTKAVEIAKLPDGKMQAAFDRAMGRGTPSGGNTFEPAEWGGTEESKGVKDGLGHVIPDDIAHHFIDAEGLKEALGYIAKAKKKLKELSGLDCFYQVNFQAVDSCLKNTVSELKPYRPHTECPKCRRKISKNCDLCKGIGIITFAQYGSGKGGGVLTNEEREWLDSRG